MLYLYSAAVYTGITDIVYNYSQNQVINFAPGCYTE